VRKVVTHSERETIALGAEMAAVLKPGDVVAFYGDLGSGKTRFIKGICQGLGVQEHVASPTFTIVHEYCVGDLRICHFDFYRMKSIAEIHDIGFGEYVNGDGICLIEWAEKARELLPPHRYEVTMQLGVNESSREVTIEEMSEVAA